mmetsp:Transcript_15236/g.33072  ORF Transcript_15236/g.33072 Transcript_15236/m.33072 type:complete len:1605 (-) Transcript_15236:173-4987(-)|eukprot:CAMPEP_0172301402 /NCGR_PEP_ID=MMETSP1058-20130122/3292_1 /TAXON_ID=83371 /ORGANISM="Detonula confervacea, Strain CCMP 353" /LENGTH=1604 /DNA_ID=CAMNT_0013011497 /DNA_START=75 /DNA_END=4889 /DNA_ORIENTATION=+
MGKNKSNKGSSSSSKGGAPPKCTCDHPFQCDCGNRPERPSRGHKWDSATQQWGGKGHKQKGASGQIHSVSQADKVTSVGNTVLKQWQKLPTRLLSDLCKKNGKALGKGLPIYRPVNNRGGGGGGGGGDGKAKYRYRLIIPDNSKKGSSEHDIVVTPSMPVSNEEQAREEAALLGLLYLFPKLPHERTLPEPYRSTFLAALKNSDGTKNATSSADSNAPSKGGKADSTPSLNGTASAAAARPGVATANTQLTANLPSFHLKNNNRNNASRNNTSSSSTANTSKQPLLTRAQINEARKQHQREVQARIRKHEAIRNANKPMEVFMSARFRRRIECLLAGNVFEEEEEEEDAVNLNNDDGEEDVILSYVHQRLVHEGFASSHVVKAYRVVMKEMSSSMSSVGQDEYMDKAYEEALQYLCIHLREDQLPIGFDGGGTLDVLSPTTGNNNGGKKQSDGALDKKEQKGDGANGGYDANILQFAEYFGLTPKEAFAIHSSNKSSFTFSSTCDELALKRAFWKVLGDAASLPIERACFGATTNTMSDEVRQRNEEAADNECEALEAIFEEGEYSIKKDSSFTSVTIALPFGDESKLSLEIHYTNGMYPDLLPMVFVTTGNRNGEGISVRPNKFRFGGRVHLNLAQYLLEMAPGQEVIFELFGHVQSLLQDEEESPASLDNVSELLSHLKLDNGIGSVKASNSNGSPGPTQSKTNDQAKDDKSRSSQATARQLPKKQPAKPFRRPRQRATFWNTHPSKTPPAVSFPKLSIQLDRARKSLPAAKAKDEFLSLMARAKAGGRVVLVTGETGCGKTTQIPQFVLENSPKEAKIIVAQPRRLAATGVASRVALERGESNPGIASVGSVVRGDSKMCSSTRLVFCTTGILLRQLQSQNALENISHIVIDEVHERHLDTDVLLAILKQTLPSLPNLTVVLMSATMDADRFAKYWGVGTPRMHIPGFTHPVQDFTLEDVLEMTCYIPPKKKKQSQYSRGGGGGSKYQIQPSFVDGNGFEDDEECPAEKGSSSMPMSCAVPLEERLKRMNEDEIDYDLIAVLIKTILQTKEDDGSLLVFLPGAGEIDRAERAIHQIVKGHALTILPLHGGLQADKQQQVFVPARRGYTKVILSTNVAETSITIPDCTIVIDTCKEKQSSFDPVNRMPMLLERFASQDSLKQRRGRAGRVRPGTCYKMISSSLFNKLPEHGEPEIRRCALDQTILSLLFLGLENGSGNFLRIMLDPPSQQSVDSALYSLEKTGALDRDGDLAFLTPLGTHLAGIPAPPTVGKLLVMGCLLGTRDISVAIAAGMSAGRSPFLRINTFNNGRQRGKDDMEQEKQEFTNGKILEERAALFKMVGNSDHAMLGKAFLLWKESQGASERRRFCDKLGLAFNSMRDILTLTRQLDSSLTNSGFLPSKECNKNESSWRIVRSMLVSSLSPTQVVRVQRPSTKYTETVEGSIEKEGKSKELKFFIRGGSESMGGDANHNSATRSKGKMHEERVFLHPSSNNFSIGSYSCPWLVYHRLIRTSKAFVSDSTECNPYSLLLFGGSMEVQASNGLIVLDDWIRFSANARIGSLIGGLRQKVDGLLEQKVADPSLDITGSMEMKLITDLLRHDGV